MKPPSSLRRFWNRITNWTRSESLRYWRAKCHDCDWEGCNTLLREDWCCPSCGSSMVADTRLRDPFRTGAPPLPGFTSQPD